jgi:hypothetical protein
MLSVNAACASAFSLILTIENTDQSIKIFENYASRAIDPNATVLLAGASYDDNLEMVTMSSLP